MISPEDYRKGIVEVLQLASSRRFQLDYQEKTPVAQVVAEVFCQWDDLYAPEVATYEVAFSDSERIALAEYDQLNSSIAKNCQALDLPNFHGTSYCEDLKSAAKSALLSLGIVDNEAD